MHSVNPEESGQVWVEHSVNPEESGQVWVEQGVSWVVQRVNPEESGQVWVEQHLELLHFSWAITLLNLPNGQVLPMVGN